MTIYWNFVNHVCLESVVWEEIVPKTFILHVVIRIHVSTLDLAGVIFGKISLNRKDAPLWRNPCASARPISKNN